MKTPVTGLRMKPELSAKVKKAIESGDFKTITEVIEAALQEFFRSRDARQ